MIDIAEDVDVVGAFDLGGFDRRPILGCRLTAQGGDRRGEQDE